MSSNHATQVMSVIPENKTKKKQKHTIFVIKGTQFLFKYWKIC